MAQYDLLVHNVRRVDVGLKAVTDGWMAVRGGKIALLGNRGSEPFMDSKQILDGEGCYLLPSLIDAHMHIESSFTTPRRFVQAVLPHGTGAVLADPHEIANVAGQPGVKYLVGQSQQLPLDIFFALPSCVPATSSGLESAGACFGIDDLATLRQASDRFIALGEVMDYVSLLDPNSRLFPILAWAKENNLIIDGHCPSLGAQERQQYFAQGVMADHTLAFPEKIADELRMGIWVQLQEKSLTPENIDFIKGRSLENILFVTDDYAPSKFAEGHLNSILRRAVAMGLDPLEVISSATIRAAQYLRRDDIGVLAPGRWANFWLCQDLAGLRADRAYFRGKSAQEWVTALDGEQETIPGELLTTCNLPNLTSEDFQITAGSRIPAIVSNGVNTATELEWIHFVGHPEQSPPPPDCVWALCVHRHSGPKRLGMCLLKDFGLRRGALASTVAHDSHNLIAVGHFPDILQAIDRLQEIQGGMVAVAGGEVISEVALPIGGLISDGPVDELAKQIGDFESAMASLGVNHQRALTFLVVLSLTVSPYYKLTDRGLVDVEKRSLIWHHQN